MLPNPWSPAFQDNDIITANPCTVIPPRARFLSPIFCPPNLFNSIILHQCSMTNHYFGIFYCLYRLFSIYWGTHPHTRTPLCAVFGQIFLSPDNRARARGMTVALYDVILPRQLSRAAAAVNIFMVGEMHQCEPLAFP